MKTMSFLAGAAVGYVLGARAGQERYKEIVARVRDLSTHPTVQQAQAKVTELLNSRSDATSGQPSSGQPSSGQPSDATRSTPTGPI